MTFWVDQNRVKRRFPESVRCLHMQCIVCTSCTQFHIAALMQHDLYVNNLVGDVKANPRDLYRYINSQKKDTQGIPP